jgi:hypothetical protein
MPDALKIDTKRNFNQINILRVETYDTKDALHGICATAYTRKVQRLTRLFADA